MKIRHSSVNKHTKSKPKAHKKRKQHSSQQPHLIARPFATGQHFSTSTTSDNAVQEQQQQDQEQPQQEEQPKKRLPPRNLADGDRIMKVFGSPLDEDPTEPMIRSILPGGIARATGIENPRLGAYVTIYLNQKNKMFEHTGSTSMGGVLSDMHTRGESRDVFNANQNNKEVTSSNQPTLQPAGNMVHAEIIRITKHETFLALPCQPNLINIEDPVAKTTTEVPSFRVPITTTKRRLKLLLTHPDDLEDELDALNKQHPHTRALDDQTVTPLLGCVLNAMGDPTEQLVKPEVVIEGEPIADTELKVQASLLHQHTLLMPYSNIVAKNVLKKKLRTLPHTLNSLNKRAFGIEEGNKNMLDPTFMNQHEYQQLLQTFNDTASYTKAVDEEEYDHFDQDGNYADGGSDDQDDDDNNTFDIHKLMEAVEHQPPHLKKSELQKKLRQQKKVFTEQLQLPAHYQSNFSSQLVTGIPQLDMMNPLRKGQRVLFTSTDRKELGQLAQVMLRNILLQTISAQQSPDLEEKKAKLDLSVDATMLYNDIDQEGVDEVEKLAREKLFLKSLQADKTIGLYCTIGTPNQEKNKIIKALDPVLGQTIIIHTNEHDTPYAHKQAVKQAVYLSNMLRNSGKDVVLVLDDLAVHSQAVAKLQEPFNIAAGAGISGIYHNVNSHHAQLLDQIGTLVMDHDQDKTNNTGTANSRYKNNTIGSSTAICLYTTFPESPIPSIQQRHSEQVLDGLKSTVDRNIPFHPHLQGGGFWPAIEVQPLHPTLPTVSPIMRTLLQNVNAKIIESNNLFEYSKIQEGLGIPLDFDVEQVIEWKPKLQAMLMQSPNHVFSLEEQYVLLFAATQERLLAGIDMVDIPSYKRFLIRYMQQYPSIMAALGNITHVSTQLPLKDGAKHSAKPRRDFVDPTVVYAEHDNAEGMHDEETAALFAKYKAQPFLTSGRDISPVEDFVGGWFYKSINKDALDNPMAASLFSTTHGGRDLGDQALLQPILMQVRGKYFAEETQRELQSPEQKVQFESLFKANTVGKYGLPALLDEVLQVIVDNAHEKFLTGQWQLEESNYQHLPGVKHNYVQTAAQEANQDLYQSPALRGPDGQLNPKAVINIPTVMPGLYDVEGAQNGGSGAEVFFDAANMAVPVKKQSRLDAVFSSGNSETSPQPTGVDEKSSGGGGGGFGSWFGFGDKKQ